MKFYIKRGVHNYQEKKYEKALEDLFEKHPEKLEGVSPAKSFEELKQIHDQYCIESVEFTETKNDGTESSSDTGHKNFRDSLESEENHVDDPLNRDEPIIRNYVKDDGFSDSEKKEEAKSNYDEPTSFRDSFEIPDDNITDDKGQASNQPLNAKPQQKQQQKSGPADPDAKVHKKSRKKFTKYAVDAVCALAGRGIVWWTTKDITDEALQAAIMNDEISTASLNLIVHLDSSTQGTVKQFFQQICLNAQDLANFTTEEKQDLVDALDDFLEYKKVEINPTINLGTVFLGMMFDRALKAFQYKAEAGSILTQLKTMHESGSTAPNPQRDNQGEHHEEPVQQQSEQASHSENVAEKSTVIEDNELLDIEKTFETKE